jgi:DNA polymerase III beta subunit-like protein
MDFPLRASSGGEEQRITLTFSGSDGVVIVQDGAIKTEPAPAQWLFRTEIPVILRGQAFQEEFTVALNRAYLRESLSALNIGPNERVEMCFNGPEVPMLLKPDGDPNRFTLIMPMHRHR